MDKGVNKKREPIGSGYSIFVSAHHTFGTDAVLLANFAAARQGDKLVDLGTGCGIIAFLIMRDKRLARAFGVDISSEAIELCHESAKECGFSPFEAVCSNLCELKGKLPFGDNTLVVCNPPYKADKAGLQNPDSVIKTARHEVECTLEDIISVSARLLQTSGRLCMCHRPERLAELMSLMRKYKLEPKRLRTVAKRVGQKPWLVLVEARKQGNTGLTIEPELYVHDQNGNFSEEMIKIYGSYKENYI